jgi:hypothetical protein
VISSEVLPDVPNMRRQITGVEVDPDVSDEYKIIRSITMLDDGNLKSDAFLSEIFSGTLTFASGWTVDIFAQPSTILLNSGASVVMASQIYERKYTINRDEYSGASTFNEYFKKRKNFHKEEKTNPEITWLGAPSIVYTYKHRNNLKQFLKNIPAINMFFWITSFNSTKCIGDQIKHARSYCRKFETLKEKCKNTDDYQKHTNYYDQMRKEKNTISSVPSLIPDGKYITNFERAIEVIKKNEDAMDDYNNLKGTRDFHRYNELFTYFFPWDIDGIERGGISNKMFEKLLNEINTERIKTIVSLECLLKLEDFIGLINFYMKFIKKQDLSKLAYTALEINLLSSFCQNFNSTHYVLSKFILISECYATENLRDISLKPTDKDRISGLITEIIKIMNNELTIYEYQLQENNKFEMVNVGAYGLYDNSKVKNRESPFTLFEQGDPDVDTLTHVTLAKQQLSPNRDDVSSGGKKGNTRKRKAINKSSRRKTRK